MCIKPQMYINDTMLPSVNIQFCIKMVNRGIDRDFSFFHILILYI